MALTRGLGAGIVASVVLGLAAIMLFFQFKDPMIIVFAVQLILAIWVVVLIVHVIRNGIPIRIVGDKREKP